MPRHWRVRYPGAKYHVTVRGNGRGRVFLTERDHERFLAQLDEACATDRVVLYAYVLMPNHYHLLVETPRANLPRFMQRLNTAYGMYFRFRHARAGHCFQGRYGARLAEGDDYLLRLTRYLHLNPVKTKVMAARSPQERLAALREYRWSSYRGYAGHGPAEARVNYRWLGLMGRRTRGANRAAYRMYVERQAAGREADAVLDAARDRDGYVLGDGHFREQVDGELYAARMSKVQTGDIVWPAGVALPIERVLSAVAEAFDRPWETLAGHGRSVGPVKAVAIELCSRLTGESQRVIARRFGYRHESAVGKQRQAYRRLCARDPRLARQSAKLETALCRF